MVSLPTLVYLLHSFLPSFSVWGWGVWNSSKITSNIQQDCFKLAIVCAYKNWVLMLVNSVNYAQYVGKIKFWQTTGKFWQIYQQSIIPASSQLVIKSLITVPVDTCDGAIDGKDLELHTVLNSLLGSGRPVNFLHHCFHFDTVSH